MNGPLAEQGAQRPRLRLAAGCSPRSQRRERKRGAVPLPLCRALSPPPVCQSPGAASSPSCGGLAQPVLRVPTWRAGEPAYDCECGEQLRAPGAGKPGWGGRTEILRENGTKRGVIANKWRSWVREGGLMTSGQDGPAAHPSQCPVLCCFLYGELNSVRCVPGPGC